MSSLQTARGGRDGASRPHRPPHCPTRGSAVQEGAAMELRWAEACHVPVRGVRGGRTWRARVEG